MESVKCKTTNSRLKTPVELKVNSIIMDLTRVYLNTMFVRPREDPMNAQGKKEVREREKWTELQGRRRGRKEESVGII